MTLEDLCVHVQVKFEMFDEIRSGSDLAFPDVQADPSICVAVDVIEA